MMVHRIFVILNVIVAVSFLVSGIDDLFVDVYYWLRKLYRKLFISHRIHPVTEADLACKPEKWTAIWIPAWHEDGVIDRMLLNTIESLSYGKYEIFVGTYPNDEATQLAVESVRERNHQVNKIVCPNPGPTNKADCLNWVYQGMQLAEQEKGIRYEVVVLHDSEDVIHPLELRLLNWLIPRKDMVQLPVVPLEMPARYWTAGTYLDEFAENHSKDLLVRERLGPVIPSAGVGTGFSRAVLDEVARGRGNQLFNINTVTEDYDFGFSLLPFNRHGILAQFSVLRTQLVTCGFWRRRQEVRQILELVGVREFFPDSFRLAVRQKSRWVLGIALQGWKNLGWQGGFWGRYMLYRDRKSLLTNVINALGYLVVCYWLVLLITQPPNHVLSLVPARWVWDVILVDTILMVNRLAQRLIAVHRVAGWKQALLSIPRAVVSNAVNFCATTAAVRQFLSAQREGRQVAWQKTDHAFPKAEQLREYRRRLGDLLLENRLINVAELREALASQKENGGKLGEVLQRLGYIREDHLLPVLARQFGVSLFAINHRMIDRNLLQKLPRQMAEDMLALPVAFSDGAFEVACANPSPDLKYRLEEMLRRPVHLSLAGENDMRFAICRAYLFVEGSDRMCLGELLVSAGMINRNQLERALLTQKLTRQRLGEVLQDQGLVSPQVIAAALRSRQLEPSAEAKGSSQ
jgi:bacteriophage N4 adsorption protein B